ncbi:class I SAM-dependent methyltransferase [Rhodococcus daqingensis]|uniref:Class I SAM-dependent methyltransferase n=1 Tax=Rhodococcus daqingensis TaxID=2479363 RepID=A0ABW2S3N7_9NOCA
MTDYWNHNSAYHDWIVGIATQHRGDVLDVGCGDGLLAQRLSPVSATVTGIDMDPSATVRARARTSGLANVSIDTVGFDEHVGVDASYDVVTFVAALHHLDLRSSLRRARSLLRPGGELVVVGLSANTTPSDWVLSALQVPVVRVASWWHGEARDIGVVTAEPREGLREIRAIADQEVPGARIRRGLYYRYLLRWRRG